ncbi:hypothetical protein ACERII_13280 [Evansella sp. AB-rgal1]|uniref:hypothetical protein n=1 Tax=Evansella sp. AB-rgal1 TaxID=3242696 RepID=UPI00359CC9E5
MTNPRILFLSSVLIFILFFVACSEQDYEKEDIAAVLNGEEITYEEIMWQFSLEDDLEKWVTAYLKQEIFIIEAKTQGITVTDEEKEERKEGMFPGTTASERYELMETKELFDSQATLLGVTPKEYYEVWEDKSHRAQAYIDKYIDEIFGRPTEGDDVDKWGQEIDEHIEDLFNDYIETGKLEMK